MYLSLACHSSACGALSLVSGALFFLSSFFYASLFLSLSFSPLTLKKIKEATKTFPFEPADGKLQGNYFSFVFIIVLFLLSVFFFLSFSSLLFLAFSISFFLFTLFFQSGCFQLRSPTPPRISEEKACSLFYFFSTF